MVKDSFNLSFQVVVSIDTVARVVVVVTAGGVEGVVNIDVVS